MRCAISRCQRQMLPRDMQERRLTQAAAKGDAGSCEGRCSTLQMPTQAAAFLSSLSGCLLSSYLVVFIGTAVFVFSLS